VGPYTALQLFETSVFTIVAVYGIVARHPSIGLVGVGLLVGKAVMNILPRSRSVTFRSLVGYGVGLSLAGACVVLIRTVLA
jgi:hypothetical protein